MQKAEKDKVRLAKRSKNLDLFDLIKNTELLSPPTRKKRHESEQLNTFEKHGKGVHSRTGVLW